MHKTIITGNITKQGATLRTTQGGDKVLGFSVGVSNGKDSTGQWRDKTFFDCSIWGRRAEKLEGYMTAGTSLTLIGRVSAREHSGKAYLQLSVDDFSFNSTDRTESRQNQGYDDNPQGGHSYGAGGSAMSLEDDVPFAPVVLA